MDKINKMIRLSLLLVILYQGVNARDSLAELSLEQAMKAGISHHPAVEAEHYQELSKQQNEEIAKSHYYPKISAMALATTGFPGSAGATNVGGLMVSPYHKGPSAGLLLEQNIWDFGRTSESVRLAEKETVLSQREAQVSSLRIGQNVQQAFFLCSKDRSLFKLYAQIALESELIQKEVKKFVQVGQRSIVEKYLSESQMEEAKTIANDYQTRFQIDDQKLALLTGEKNEKPLCPFLEEHPLEQASPKSNSLVSPLIMQADAQTAVAQTEKALAQKDFNPRIVGLASAGWMQDTELGIPMKNYSAAIGVIFPLFEGFKTSSEVKKYDLKTIQSEKERDATLFRISEANLNYTRTIESSKVRMSHLRNELKIAEAGYETAKKRYLALQGTLIDVRESLRNLARTSGDLKEATFEFLNQTTERDLLNGAWNSILAKTQK